MPIEFSTAAYRFGHSMVRPIHRLNTRLHGGDNPELATPDEINRGLKGRFFIFAGVQSRGLNGFDAFPEQRAIDWSLYAEPVRLGAVGGGIVAETLIGVLAADGRSPLRQNPNWQPVADRQPIRTMGSLLKFASG